ncbi:MAG: glutamate--cysteine ligase [Gammaproteobacteria bacterium]|nr:glutamate--cysteine ligase [Gammaproteobacteria bacterium]
MYTIFDKRLSALQNTHHENLFINSKTGIEKECLRVSENGTIASSPHPKALGSALTNPHITTDYSEALLEFITPPLGSVDAALDFLRDTQKFVYDHLQNDILWCNSMPCILSGETRIPVAQYGHSNAGRMKTIYRYGLGYRYGKMMQVIAGIHYNYSLPATFWPVYQALENNTHASQDFISESYFCLIRNLQRFGWLVPYLFGASPTVCKSFMDGIEKILQPLDEHTCYEPYATSLRLSDIGYQNYKEDKSGIKANYDNLSSYIASLKRAIETPNPDYQKIGVKVNGEYRQLNANLLQIENEYYSTIRPKQTAGTYEKPTTALEKRGVDYIELRSLDLNMLHPLGANKAQMHFLEAFLIFCLLQESPTINATEQKEIDKNQSITALRGREPGLQLMRCGKPITLTDWAREICVKMRGICELLDHCHNTNDYQAALNTQGEAVEDSEKCPSAIMLSEMQSTGESFFPYSMRYAKQHAAYFSTLDLPLEKENFFVSTAEKSIKEQQRIESKDNLSFDTFLQRYFSDSL